MLDGAEFRRWREAADDALAGARVQAEAGFPHWSCFMAEQSANLAVKALLHGIGAGPWGHDLVALGAALAQASGGALPDDAEAALRRLSRHYIPSRYPDALPGGSPRSHYGPSDAEQALADAEQVARLVDAMWDDLTAAGEGS